MVKQIEKYKNHQAQSIPMKLRSCGSSRYLVAGAVTQYGGQVQVMFSDMSSIEYIGAGKLRALRRLPRPVWRCYRTSRPLANLC
jgi:hypothetical protein